MFATLLFLQIVLTVSSQSNNGVCQTPDKQSGFCIPVQTCRTMQDFVSKVPQPVSQEIRQKLNAYQCGVVNRKPKVCCPSTPIDFDTSEGTSQERFHFPDVSRHRNLNLIPKDCGHLDTVKKIVNGNKTSLFEFPWMALLQYNTARGPEFHCGGSIINKRYILTAAHCVTGLDTKRDKYTLRAVRVGEHDLRTEKDCEEDDPDDCAPPVQDVNIEEVIFHPQYNMKSHVNDIALLRVALIDLTQENSRPVCLPFEGTGNFNYTNRRVVVTGWGDTEDFIPSSVLLKAELNVSPLKECSKQYEKVYNLIETQICAGGNRISDSCGGDSGGPLHSLEALNDQARYIQQGIVSFGPKFCGKLSLPGVYTRVASYMDWILDNIKP